MIHFIVGTGRCGSSLVHELLSHHEGCAFVSNLQDNVPALDFTARFNSAIYGMTKGAFTQKGRLRFAPSEAYQIISQQVSPIYANSSRDLLADDVTPWLRQRMVRFFQDQLRRQAKPTFLHKYTGWPRIGFFGEIFPGAKFVDVVRDGRAVANSWLQMSWWGGYRGPENWLWGPLSASEEEAWNAAGRSFPVLAGIGWKKLIGAFDTASAAASGESYRRVRYEDFLQRPEDTLREICEFLGIGWSSQIQAALSRITLDAGRARSYEKDLTSVQLSQLEEVIGEDLARLGYS